MPFDRYGKNICFIASNRIVAWPVLFVTFASFVCWHCIIYRQWKNAGRSILSAYVISRQIRNLLTCDKSSFKSSVSLQLWKFVASQQRSATIDVCLAYYLSPVLFRQTRVNVPLHDCSCWEVRLFRWHFTDDSRIVITGKNLCLDLGDVPQTYHQCTTGNADRNKLSFGWYRSEQ